MIYLRQIKIEALGNKEHVYPHGLPLVKNFGTLELNAPVSFVVGENGSGKSTILEALAVATGLPAVGQHSVEDDPSLNPARELAQSFRLIWSKKVNRGFFLRAEDFFNFSKRMADMLKELEELKNEYDQKEGSGWDYASGGVAAEIAGIKKRYGKNLDENSHGEGFLKLFENRFVPKALYILDEPEAPLSPQRQLTLISMIKEMVDEHSAQFIIATHSPILMGYPGAQILNFDQVPPVVVEYEETEHYQLTKNFLLNRETFLRHL